MRCKDSLNILDTLYCNEHEGGLGDWTFSISVEDVGGPLENGEEVIITVEYLFGTLLIVESI